MESLQDKVKLEVIFRCLDVFLERLGSLLEASWELPGSLSGPLGSLLEALGGLFGRLGGSREPLESSRRSLGILLGESWGLLERS